MRALLLTGVYGTGKTSVAVEIADILEKRGEPYAVLDLDWLMWFQSSSRQVDGHSMRLGSDITSGRQDDLRAAALWLATKKGEGFEDLALPNDRPLREVATDILDWLG